MRCFLPCLLLLAGAACAGPAPQGAIGSQSPESDVVLYEGATLIDGETGQGAESSAFLVDGGTIVQVGKMGAIALPAGARRVDLSGKTVMPALVSAHMHVGLLDGGDFGPQVYTRDKIVEHLQRYAYYGLGAVFTAGTDVGPLSFDVHNERPAGAAWLLTAGRGVATPDGGPGFPAIANTSVPITTAAEGRQHVRMLKAQGSQAVKIWVDDRGGRMKKLTPDLYRPIIEEAHANQMQALAHVYYLKDAHELVDAGIDGLMHLVRDEVMDDDLIARMKARRVVVAANIGGSRRNALEELPPASATFLSETVPADVVQAYQASLAAKDATTVSMARATYDKMTRSLAKLNAAGITIVLGGDTGIPNAWHGWGEHYELETMAAAGMTPAQVIVAATSAAARLLKLDDMGTLAPGKRADFIVLDANPLQDIANTRRIAAVYLGGTALDRAALRARWTKAGPAPAPES